MNIIELIHGLPAQLEEERRVSIACYIASILGDCEGMGSIDGQWEVYWTDGVTGFGAWVSRHGVFVSDDLDEAKAYQIIGYCAMRDIPWFTEDKLLLLENDQ